MFFAYDGLCAIWLEIAVTMRLPPYVTTCCSGGAVDAFSVGVMLGQCVLRLCTHRLALTEMFVKD